MTVLDERAGSPPHAVFAAPVARQLTAPAVSPLDERSARNSLRLQIARLERELGELTAATYPRLDQAVTHPPGVRGLGGPRLLDLGELERLRDGLLAALAGARDAAAAQAQRQEDARDLLERMLREPARHRWVRVRSADIGEPGCRQWHVLPHLGPIGLLMGWWRVKVSSGCPLDWGARPPAALPCP
jgi:hypothetical protein